MARQQPPTLPWFRLASVSRPTRAPTTASAPPQARALAVAQPSPSIIRPTLTQSSYYTPTQPAQPPLAPLTQAPTPLPVAASPPVPASKSPPPQAATAPPATAFPRNPTTPPPRATAPPPAQAQKSPPQRADATPPSLVPVAPPKSPTSTTFPNAISLEPRIIREELKSTVSPKVMPSNGQTHSTDISRLNEKPDVRKDNGNYKKLSDSEEFGRMVITVAGENKGAIMEWTPSITKNSPLSPHKNGGNPRTGSVGKKYRSDSGSSNEEGRGKSKDKSYKAMNNSSPPMSAFMNSNVQGVNNSILYNCSYRHHDPGVHCSLYRKANGHGNGIKPNNEDRASGINW